MSRTSQPAPFFYIAASAAGGRSLGIRQAHSRRALASDLRKDRLVLLRAWALPSFLASTRRLTPADHIQLNELLSQLQGRGVPLVETLEVIARTVRSEARPRIERLAELVSQGSSFADACARVGGFDEVTIAVYRAAERSGDLAPAGEQLATAIRRRRDIASKATTVMIYPIIVLTLGIIVGIGMLVGIIPMVARGLEKAGADIPWFTALLVGAGTALREHWAVALLVVGLAGVLAYLSRARIGAALGRASRSLPLIRDVVLAQEASSFFSVMGAMTRSGVPLADALAVAQRAVRHERLREQLARLRERLVQGGVLRDLIEDVDALPLATRRLLVAAERAGDLEAAFNSLADDMRDEVEKRSSRLLAFLEPALLLFLFAFVGSMVLAIMLPMLSAVNQF